MTDQARERAEAWLRRARSGFDTSALLTEGSKVVTALLAANERLQKKERLMDEREQRKANELLGLVIDLADMKAEKERLTHETERLALELDGLRELVAHTLDEYGERMPSQWKAHARVALSRDAATEPTCICPRFLDWPDGTIIANLTCPVHGARA